MANEKPLPLRHEKLPWEVDVDKSTPWVASTAAGRTIAKRSTLFIFSIGLIKLQLSIFIIESLIKQRTIRASSEGQVPFARLDRLAVISLAPCEIRGEFGEISLRSAGVSYVIGERRMLLLQLTILAAILGVAIAQNETSAGKGLYCLCLQVDAVVDDPCAEATSKSYNFGLHVGAIFIILCTSLFGASIPLVANRLWQKMDPIYLACGKMFGAGVILSTSLIHMFPAADQVHQSFIVSHLRH